MDRFATTTPRNHANSLCANKDEPDDAEDDDGQPGADHQQRKYRWSAFALTRLGRGLDDLSVFLGCQGVLALLLPTVRPTTPRQRMAKNECSDSMS